MFSLGLVTLLLLPAFHLLIVLCFPGSQPALWEPLSSSVARCHQVALLQHYETEEAIPQAPAWGVLLVSSVSREDKWLRGGCGLVLHCATHLLSFGSSLPGRIKQCFPFLPFALSRRAPPSGEGWNGVTVPFWSTWSATGPFQRVPCLCTLVVLLAGVCTWKAHLAVWHSHCAKAVWLWRCALWGGECNCVIILWGL